MALKFPPLYLLTANFAEHPQELYRLQEEIRDVHGALVFKKEETEIFLAKEIVSNKRASLELRKLGLRTQEIASQHGRGDDEADPESQKSPRKRRKLSHSEDGWEIIDHGSGSETESTDKLVIEDHNTIKVLKLSWYTDSLKAGELLPYDNYLVYEGEILPADKSNSSQTVTLPSRGSDLLIRARVDTPPPSGKKFFGKHRSPQTTKGHHRQPSSQRALLVHETTEEQELDMPHIPDYLHTVYSCQRPTPLHCPNEEFLTQLRILQKARKLTEKKKEDMNARAYNSAIATIASYPHALRSARELIRLPNCGNKMAMLWREWREEGHIKEVDDIVADERMQALNIFVEIHDVGPDRANEFYNRGWRDLNDVIEFGWDTLTKNQQVFVKFYDEFTEKIPRVEVESTAKVILDHANAIRGGFQMVVCGGYRRGKIESGDIDVVLSHPDEEVTLDFLPKLLQKLKEGWWIPYELQISHKNSARGQTPVSWKGGMGKAGSGFDTLDHAFVVWQDPDWIAEEEDMKNDPEFKNPNPHRRVDIIISPWKTAGCAVIGWTGGTMFQRDLRSYCKEKLNLKFDSSGVRRQDDGSWVDLEAGDGDMLVKEKRVFAGLKLEWREPTERCTD
ncbi:DNA polymerase beta [Acephala macrosclerotiorum]|nr:DNA polymerase beta [Acephala macrosclerotiorum]